MHTWNWIFVFLLVIVFEDVDGLDIFKSRSRVFVEKCKPGVAWQSHTRLNQKNIVAARTSTCKEEHELISDLAPREEEEVYTTQCSIFDFGDIIRLSLDQFASSCKTEKDRKDLKSEIINLFLPKLVIPLYGHKIIGIKAKKKGQNGKDRLIGFVDLSLQVQSLDALKPLSYFQRIIKYGRRLRPYLCNLIVSPDNRRKGYGKKLVHECFVDSKLWGYKEIYLHVEYVIDIRVLFL